jgi:hypothetical protein
MGLLPMRPFSARQLFHIGPSRVKLDPSLALRDTFLRVQICSFRAISVVTDNGPKSRVVLLTQSSANKQGKAAQGRLGILSPLPRPAFRVGLPS